jgi:hypothetical protein
MKKTFLATLAMLISLISRAQIAKNQWLMGGELNLSYRKDALQKTTYNISPTIGHFIRNKFAVGARANFTNNSSGYYVNPNRNLNSIGPFLRYYFLSKDQKVNLFGDAAYLYSWAGASKLNSYEIKTGPAFFVSPSVALEFTVGYLHSKYVKFDYKVSEVRTGVGFRVHLGRAKQATSHNIGG